MDRIADMIPECLLRDGAPFDDGAVERFFTARGDVILTGKDEHQPLPLTPLPKGVFARYQAHVDQQSRGRKTFGSDPKLKRPLLVGVTTGAELEKQYAKPSPPEPTPQVAEPKKTFDRVAYQRELMRKRRSAKKADDPT
jgi:hypothetical protein